MMELIDRKAFVEKCLKYFDNGLVCENVASEICESHGTCVECIIDTMPLIDAVPVVRCKDCVFSRPNDGKLVDGARYCYLNSRGSFKKYIAIWDVDYCSKGDRKEVKE